MKLVVDEPETAALRRYVEGLELAASRLALAEVPRAVKLSGADVERLQEAELMLVSLLLVDVSEPVLRRAGELGSLELRTLDAIHLASAERIGASELITYDRRLAVAAAGLGFEVASPA